MLSSKHTDQLNAGSRLPAGGAISLRTKDPLNQSMNSQGSGGVNFNAGDSLL